MQTQIEDGETFDLRKVGLIAVIVVTVPKRKSREMRHAYTAHRNLFVHSHERTLPTEVFMDDQRHARRGTGGNHCPCRSHRFRQRFLADHRQALCGGQFNKMTMRGCRCGDIHKIKRHLV